MVTCRQLLALDIFKNIELIAGYGGLDKTVSWPYAKHTKSITPWVKGGEFILVSGYEYGMSDDELMQLIAEASINDISGLLVEGGINFKNLSDVIIEKANDLDVPLFFAKGVVSFLDVTREISALLNEEEQMSQKTVSCFDQFLNEKLSQKERDQLLWTLGLSNDACFITAVFDKNELDTLPLPEREASMISYFKKLEKIVHPQLENAGIKPIYKVNLTSVDYILYGNSESKICESVEMLKKINAEMNKDGIESYLSFGEIIYDVQGVLNGLNEAYFTNDLMKKGIFPQKNMLFAEAGSYRLIFNADDAKKLISFRDRYLKKLRDADGEGSSQLMETLYEYLSEGGNILQTSKNLYIHRNTLQYRLQRIEKITHLDLTDFHVRQDFLNAYAIADVYPFEKR